MIKNLIFDFGKVLVDYEYFETLDQIFKTHEQAEEFYHLLIDGKWNENMDRGDSFEETFCKMQQIMPQYKEEIATVAQRFNEFVRGEKEGMRHLADPVEGRRLPPLRTFQLVHQGSRNDGTISHFPTSGRTGDFFRRENHQTRQSYL